MDAVSATLDRFHDLSEWVCVPDVPVFAPHTRETEKGTIVVTPEDLPHIADATNRLEQAGLPARMTIGHVRDCQSELDQPLVVGFWRNFRVGNFGPHGRPGILADAWIMREHYPLVKGYQYPYRSAEYSRDTGEIRGVALLTRDSYLNLGIVHYALEDAMPLTHYEKNVKDTPPEQAKAPAPSAPDEDSELTPEEAAIADKYFAYYAKKNPWMEYARSCYEASVAAAGGTAAAPSPHNTGALAMAGKEKEGPEPEQYQSQTEQVLYERIRAIETELASARHAAKMAECKQLAAALVHEGYSLDVDYEAARLAALDESGRRNAVNYVRKHYARKSNPAAKSAGLLSVYEGPAIAGEREITIEEHRAAVRLVGPNMSYQEAIQKVRSKGVSRVAGA